MSKYEIAMSLLLAVMLGLRPHRAIDSTNL